MVAVISAFVFFGLVESLTQSLADTVCELLLSFVDALVQLVGYLLGERLGRVAQLLPCAGVKCRQSVFLQVSDIVDGTAAFGAGQPHGVYEITAV